MEVNQNIADCIVKATDFTQTTVTNVCNGDVSVVQNGTADIAIALVIFIALGGLGLMLVSYGVVMLYDAFGGRW